MIKIVATAAIALFAFGKATAAEDKQQTKPRKPAANGSIRFLSCVKNCESRKAYYFQVSCNGGHDCCVRRCSAP